MRASSSRDHNRRPWLLPHLFLCRRAWSNWLVRCHRSRAEAVCLTRRREVLVRDLRVARGRVPLGPSGSRLRVRPFQQGGRGRIHQLRRGRFQDGYTNQDSRDQLERSVIRKVPALGGLAHDETALPPLPATAGTGCGGGGEKTAPIRPQMQDFHAWRPTIPLGERTEIFRALLK